MSSAPLPTQLTVPHALLAVVVMAVWGSNFVVIHSALAQLPPLTFAAIRFALVFAPAALFVRRPDVPVSNMMAYGVSIGAGQFGALFIALHGQVTPGLASLMMQAQAFFTIGLSIVLTGERLRRAQAVALVVAVAGLGVIAANSAGSVTLLGFVLIGVASFSWAVGNTVARRAGRVEMLGYVVWASVWAVPPLVILALLVEGAPAIVAGVRAADATTWAAVGWQVVANSLFGYSVWGWLLARYPTAAVAPMALLVPVFGLAASALLLGEPLQPWKLAAAALVIAGLAIGTFGGRLGRWLPRLAVKGDR